MTTDMFPTGDYFPRKSSRALSYTVSRFRNNASCQVGNPSALVRIQQKPVPPVAEYDAWFDTVVSHDPRCRSNVTGAKLRRAVVMVRSGSSIADVCKACGTKGLRRWLKLLPPELAAYPPTNAQSAEAA